PRLQRKIRPLQITFPDLTGFANLTGMESLYLVGIGVLALFAFILCILIFRFFNFWLRARLANAPVGLFKMFGMSLRKVPVGLIVDNRITAVKAGIDIPSDPLEAHYLAGGDVSQVILALIAADKAGISLDFNRACAIDLATKGTGKTVLEAVRTSINPKVIDVPNPSMGRTTIDGVAKDGIGAKVKARVTVRSHLDRFGGSASGGGSGSGAGNEGQNAGDARQGGRSRSASADGDGGSVSCRPSRNHGLLPNEERSGRHDDARIDCRDGQTTNGSKLKENKE